VLAAARERGVGLHCTPAAVLGSFFTWALSEALIEGV